MSGHREEGPLVPCSTGRYSLVLLVKSLWMGQNGVREIPYPKMRVIKQTQGFNKTCCPWNTEPLPHTLEPGGVKRAGHRASLSPYTGEARPSPLHACTLYPSRESQGLGAPASHTNKVCSPHSERSLLFRFPPPLIPYMEQRLPRKLLRGGNL